MDSRSVAIPPPPWGQMDGWTSQRRYSPRHPPRQGQRGLFTITDLAVHDPEIGVHDPETAVHDAVFGVHDPEIRVHDGPKPVFTMDRNTQGPYGPETLASSWSLPLASVHPSARTAAPARAG